MHPAFFKGRKGPQPCQQPYQQAFGRGHGHGGGGMGRRGGEGGFGEFGGKEGRRERVFESGHIRLVVLHILKQQPSHGYEIIRAIGELVGGDYTPSPGTIYPALTYLEDLGHVQATEEGGRKRYALTPQGEAELQTQDATVQKVLQRLNQVRERQAGHRPPELMRAMENLKTAMRLKFGQGQPDAALIQRIAQVLDQAALDIERL